MNLMKVAHEKRNKFRFDIERDLRYKMAGDRVVVAAGLGQTVNIGSGGVAFVTDQPIPPGGLVELAISWPVLLDATCPMRLIVFGRILRCTGRKAACTIEKYEFRTQGRTFQMAAPTRSDGTLQRWVDAVRKENLKTNMAGA